MKKLMLDIDGVLNDYPKTFINYVNDNTHNNFKSLQELKETLSFSEFRRLKDSYKFSDYKHKAKLREGALELVNKLNKKYLVYIVTSRDLNEKNQLELTLNWLKTNNIKYDYICQSNKTLADLESKFNEPFDLVIDDDYKNVIQAKLFGCKKIIDVTEYRNLYDIMEELENENH